MIEDLNDYVSKLASLTMIEFGEEAVNAVAQSGDLQQGGIALRNSDAINTVTRKYVGEKEEKSRTLGETYFTLDDHDSESNASNDVDNQQGTDGLNKTGN